MSKDFALFIFKFQKQPSEMFYETEACNFTKKETMTQVFSCEFCEISKNTLFTEQTPLDDCFWNLGDVF